MWAATLGFVLPGLLVGPYQIIFAERAVIPHLEGVVREGHWVNVAVNYLTGIFFILFALYSLNRTGGGAFRSSPALDLRGERFEDTVGLPALRLPMSEVDDIYHVIGPRFAVRFKRRHWRNFFRLTRKYPYDWFKHDWRSNLPTYDESPFHREPRTGA